MLLQFNDDVFSENLQHYRKKKGLSRVKLAQEAGIDKLLIQGIERGRFYAQVTAEQYQRLCDTLGAPLNLPRNNKI